MEKYSRAPTFLSLTDERDIVVQIEIWATFDYYRTEWERNPFNPQNNNTYTAVETKLPKMVNTHPTATENNFFWSIPAENNQPIVLKYQHRFVDQVLTHTLPYNHILYCMDNETSVTPEWGKYWSHYIQYKATEFGKTVETTEMWDAWDLSNYQHKNTLDHPETYSFCDASQNNHQKGQKHWDNAQCFLMELSPTRPANCVKIYGADGGRFGSTQDGLERFWRNVFVGFASARFHRPDSGIGLNQTAQSPLKSMSLLLAEIDIFSSQANNNLILYREDNVAYLIRQKNVIAVYFPEQNTIDLNLSDQPKSVIQWLEVQNSRWLQLSHLLPTDGNDIYTITPPISGHSVALIKPIS